MSSQSSWETSLPNNRLQTATGTRSSSALRTNSEELCSLWSPQSLCLTAIASCFLNRPRPLKTISLSTRRNQSALSMHQWVDGIAQLKWTGYVSSPQAHGSRHAGTLHSENHFWRPQNLSWDERQSNFFCVSVHTNTSDRNQGSRQQTVWFSHDYLRGSQQPN